MKVLIVGVKNWHGRWTESTLEGFAKISYADVFFYKEESRNILIRGRNFLRKNKQLDKFYSQMFSNGNDLVSLVKKIHYDLVLILKAGDMEEEILFEVRKHVPILANWWVDDPFNQDANLDLYKYYDYFFVFDSYYIPELKKLGLENAVWLPCAFNPSNYFPGEANSKYATDLAFVGSYFPPREELFSYLKNEKLDISIWGPGWENAPLQNFFKKYPKSLKGSNLPNAEAANLYRSAKICLNLNHSHSKIDGINQRMLEIIASGGFQLCDYRDGFSAIFEDSKEIAYFKDSSDIPELVDFYLENEEKRKSIIQKGMKKVVRDHSFEARARSVLRIIQE